VILRAKYLNDLLQQLFLPPVYGFLGAMAYVLRTLSQQAKDRLYRTENDTVWDLRISLGILACPHSCRYARGLAKAKNL
jgi:hypothetical protein